MCRWWEQDKGKGVIRQVTTALNTRRRTDNTMDINKPLDDFEQFGLLDDDMDDQPTGVTQCNRCSGHHADSAVKHEYT